MPILQQFRPIHREILFREELRRVRRLAGAFNANRRRLWELERGR